MNIRVPMILATALTLAFPSFAPAATESAASANESTKLADTKAALRDLWVEHIFWVRNVVEARLDGNANKAKLSEQQVVANAHELAGAIEPYYGKAASDKLFTLLAGHWGAISEYLDAAHAGNKTAQDAAYKKLMGNADAIASFLAGANSHWPVETLRSLLAAHGAQHVQQIQQLQAKQYEQEAKTWAQMVHHVYVIADALGTGIAAQFPEKFR